MILSRPLLLALSFVAMICVHVTAQGQSLYVTPEKDILADLSSRPENISGADVIGDQVNYQTGALTFRQVDIDLPGQGPNITISRTFDVGTRTAWNWRHDLEFAEWDMEIPSVSTNTTMGSNDWKVVGANPTARCTQFGPAASVGSYTAHYWWRGAHLEIPGIGRQELMQRAPENTAIPTVTIGGVAQTFNIVTKNHWAITCLSMLKDGIAGEGFLAVSPEGTKYWFDKMVYYFEAYDFEGDTTYLYPGSRWKASLLVTRIEDRHGNFLTYSYTGNKLTGISASDGRALQIVWTANRGKPGSPTEIYHIDKIVSLPGTTLQRTWQYSYLDRGIAQGTNTQPRWDLRTLTLPDQSSWFFDIGAFPNSCVDNQAGCYWHYPGSISGSIRTPSGLTGTFKLSSSVPFRKGQFAVAPPSTAWANASLQLLELDPITFQSPFLTEKTLSGPGVQQTWSYGYSGAVLQAGQLAFGRFAVKNPDDTLDLIFVDSAWGSPTEGQVVRKEKYKGPVTGYVGTGPALRVDTFQYISMPNKIGVVPRTNSNNLGEEFAWPLKSRTTTVDGATFNYAVSTFDMFARPVTVDKWSGGMTANFGHTDVTEYHDNFNKWVLSQVSKVTNANTSIVASKTNYDASTAMPVQTYSFGKLQQTLTYDTTSTVDSGQLGTLKTVADGNNNVTTLSNWKRGIPQSIKYPATPESPTGATQLTAVNDNGWITSVTDENQFTTSYGYDAMGRITSIVYPTDDSTVWNTTTQNFIQVNYDEHGLAPGHWRSSRATGNGYLNVYYDAMWRPVLEEKLDLGNVSGTVSQVVKRYDTSGRLAFQSYPANNITDFQVVTQGTRTFYDALDRVTRVEQDSELGVLVNTTEYLAGFQTRTTNPRTLQTTTSYMAYDAPSLDLPVTIQEPESKSTTIARDVFGKPTSIARSGGGVSATRSYVYDGYQQLCKTIEPETGATVMDYDNAGNLAWSASGLTGSNYADPAQCSRNEGATSGRAAVRQYDGRNRPTYLFFPDHRGDQSWTYTPDGLVATVATDNEGPALGRVNNTYTYNKRRMLTGESVSQPGWYTWGIGYGYDGNGSLASQTYPTGLAINYAPNALGQATRVYDPSTPAQSYAASISYYPNGALKQFTYGNGLTHNMSQNARQLPLRVTDGGNALDHEYAYDANANVTAIYDYIIGAPTAQHRFMTYDNLDRLTGAGSAMFGGNDHWHFFTYDALDNLKSWKQAGLKDYANYVYDPTSNQLTNIKNTAGATVVGLSYDLQGNLANKNGQLYDFTYGNRLRTVPNKEAYLYDGHGRRVQTTKSDGSKTLWQYSQSGQMLFSWNGPTSEKTHENIYLGGSLVATVDHDWPSNAVIATKYQHTDALGSPVAVTDAAGAVIDRTNYEPYGAAINKPAYDGIGYTGHVMDGATGLTYMQQRYYDPQIGRFLSIDPVTANSGTGANFNRYWYANDNPYRFKDPDGRDCISAYGWTTCNPTGEKGRGLPTVSFPTPDGWPSLMSAANNPILYHQYRYPTPIGNKTPDSVRASVVNDPTPNNNDRPATRTGTLNDATPSIGARGFAGSLVNNDVKSYSATDQNGNTWEINVTEPSHTLSPGYVLRGVIGDELVTYGEGLGGKQAFGPVSDALINDVWIDQNQRNVDNAEGLWDGRSSE